MDISKLSKDELAAELKRRDAAEKKAIEDRRSQYQQNKNNYVKKMATQFLSLNESLRELKHEAITQANHFYNRMYEMNGQCPKPTKSFTLKNDEDTLKITVDRQERFEFTEEAQVHINAIKDIFKEKFAARNKGLYNLLDGLLIKGSKGEYDPKLLAKAKRQVRELGDDKLIEEFDKLDTCQRVSATSSYCRLYARNEDGKYEDISLQFSSL